MRLENLSKIDTQQIEWQKKQPLVYNKLKLLFILYEIIRKSRFILLFLFGFWLYQPTITFWVEKVLWQIRFLIQQLSACIIP